MRLRYGLKLRDTGWTRAGAYCVRAYFCINGGEVRACPVHVGVRWSPARSPTRSRPYYQLVPRSHAVLTLEGSGRPGLGVDDVWDHLEIRARGREARLFVESAEDGVIREAWRRMLESVPDRPDHYPPGAEFAGVVRADVGGIADFLALLDSAEYPFLRPAWFRGGRVRAGRVTPVDLGGLVARSEVPAPFWVGMGVASVGVAERVEVWRGHAVEFERAVEVLRRGWSVLVYSHDAVGFTVRHPRHGEAEGELRGLAEFVYCFRC